jgi:uncharacterized protein RhaS with RHS repeats
MFSYSYDAAGNRTAEQIDSQVNWALYNSGNQLTQNPNQQFTYDANGNLTGDSMRTFEWDVRNRLTAGTVGPHRSVFSYDALNRRSRIVEKDGGAVTADKQLQWCGQSMCGESDAISGVAKRFFDQGETLAAGGTQTTYFYTRDQLGSIREMTDAAGNLLVSYDYDPFGRAMKISGTADASFGYAGYYAHAPSGLMLTPARAYDI